MIALIDYGSGNIRSVINALRRERDDVELVSDPARLAEADAVVLPGVGAFGDCVRGLESRGLWQPLAAWLTADKPFLGICVGYQMLFDESEESPGVCGFGFFPGKVKRFATPGLKVPQIGWNQLDLAPHPLWRGLPANPHVYFVHSYFPQPNDESIVTARSTYGETFAAAAARGSVAGVQFHPEKSQDVGLGILRNFITRFSLLGTKGSALGCAG
ncbi:MAG TPA: imidazole glycerol phosphate synthase subunit HisH [Chthoniobacteraceae bacterium]|jgi:imidazole glycerol phosphate synthase glutamine amidotransferase subunit|nr:imidazole glycerol phosphate synthase subunit HisH [Chthoniobacteraceae bacterium]